MPEDEHVHDSPAGPQTQTGTTTADDPTEARGFAAYRRVLAVLTYLNA